MTFYEPTRNPLIINRRRLMGFLAGAVAAGIVTKSEALAYLQDASEKTGVTAEEWNTETINAMAGTTEVDTAADLHALVPETTEGTIQYWNVEPNQAEPEIAHEMYQAFLDAFAELLPEHYPREPGRQLQRSPRQDPNGGRGRRGTGCGQDADPVGRRVCGPWRSC